MYSWAFWSLPFVLSWGVLIIHAHIHDTSTIATHTYTRSVLICLIFIFAAIYAYWCWHWIWGKQKYKKLSINFRIDAAPIVTMHIASVDFPSRRLIRKFTNDQYHSLRHALMGAELIVPYTGGDLSHGITFISSYLTESFVFARADLMKIMDTMANVNELDSCVMERKKPKKPKKPRKSRNGRKDQKDRNFPRTVND